MPEYDPWGLSGPIRNIGGILAQTPRLRAEAAAALQRAKLTGAQIDTEGAQAEHYRAGTRKIDTETARLAAVGMSFERLRANAGPAARMLQSGKVDENLFDDFAGDLAVITGENKDDIGKTIRELAATGMVSQAGTNMTQPQLRSAAAVANPAGVGISEMGNDSRERIAAARPTIVQPGAAALPPGYMAGRTEPFNQPSAAIRAQQPMVTEEFPATEATEPVPGTPPGNSGMWWWKKQTPGTPGTPGQPAIPKRTLRRPPTDEELQGIGNRMQSQTKAPIPPPEQREVDQVYDLPKGRFKWTGKGWLPAQ